MAIFFLLAYKSVIFPSFGFVYYLFKLNIDQDEDHKQLKS